MGYGAVKRTDDSLHLRKLARLLLDTHGCGAVVVWGRVGCGKSADTFWWSTSAKSLMLKTRARTHARRCCR